MRFVLFFLFFSTALFSSDYLKNKNFFELFKGKYYTYICMHRWTYINKYKDEKILSLVAYSCLKKNYLTPALDLAKVLRFSKTGRINSTYITTLFLMKILIERYIKDSYPIKGIKLPLIEDSLLAKVFYLAQKQNPEVSENYFIVKDNEISYKIEFKEDINNIIINVYEKDKFIRKVKYW